MGLRNQLIFLELPLRYNERLTLDARAGGGPPATGSRLSILATCRFGVRTSFEALNWLSCHRSVETAF